VAGYIVVVV
jgi:hypothetical protein